MTEDEAHTKWCPLARTASVDAQTCIGSDCMAWRALPQDAGWLVSLDGAPEEMWRWDPSGHRSFQGRRVTARPAPPVSHGYCGLAGPT